MLVRRRWDICGNFLLPHVIPAPLPSFKSCDGHSRDFELNYKLRFFSVARQVGDGGAKLTTFLHLEKMLYFAAFVIQFHYNTYFYRIGRESQHYMYQVTPLGFHLLV